MKSISTAILMAFLIPTVAAAETIVLGPDPYVSYLPRWCGGNHPNTYVTGFAPEGLITGEVYHWTSCGGSGRGSRTTLYTSWHSIQWDLEGNVVTTSPWDGVLPDPAFSATDELGDLIYNAPYTGCGPRGCALTPDGARGILVTP